MPTKHKPPRKKPPASVPRRPAQPNKGQIIREIYRALERLDADTELLAIVGSWRDTLPDAEMLSLMKDYNAGRPTVHRPQ